MDDDGRENEASLTGVIQDPPDPCQASLDMAEDVMELDIRGRATSILPKRYSASLEVWRSVRQQRLVWAPCCLRAMRRDRPEVICQRTLAHGAGRGGYHMQVVMRYVSEDKLLRKWLRAPLEHALWSRKVGVVTKLLDSGLCSRELIHLHLAIRGPAIKGMGGDPALVVALLQRGAAAFVDTLSRDELPRGGSWDEPDVRTAQAPLHLAAFYGFKRIALALVEAGASIDLPDGDGCTPLSLAIAQGRHGVACFLLVQGARTDTVDRWGFPLLHRAVKCHESSSVVRLLLEAGADVLAKETDDGRTPLHEAIYGGDNTEGVLGILLAAGADLNGRDAHGNTPLMLACLDINKPERVRYLLDQGADDMLPNKDGKLPVDTFKESLAEGEREGNDGHRTFLFNDASKNMLVTLSERRKWRGRVWLVDWMDRQSRVGAAKGSTAIRGVAGIIKDLPEQGLFKEIVWCL